MCEVCTHRCVHIVKCTFINTLIYTLLQKESVLFHCLYSVWLNSSCVSLFWMVAGVVKDIGVQQLLCKKSADILFFWAITGILSCFDKWALLTRSHYSIDICWIYCKIQLCSKQCMDINFQVMINYKSSCWYFKGTAFRNMSISWQQCWNTPLLTVPFGKNPAVTWSLRTRPSLVNAKYDLSKPSFAHNTLNLCL